MHLHQQIDVEIVAFLRLRQHGAPKPGVGQRMTDRFRQREDGLAVLPRSRIFAERPLGEGEVMLPPDRAEHVRRQGVRPCPPEEVERLIRLPFRDVYPAENAQDLRFLLRVRDGLVSVDGEPQLEEAS